MDRVAVFVDAGYLFWQGSRELCGDRLAREYFALDHAVLSAKLTEFAERISGLPLLRIYWYDRTSHDLAKLHVTLADQPGIKVRMALANQRGQRKGVDSLVVADMLTLTRNRAMAECVLLSGDEGVTDGVQQAQEYGVRVHLLGIKPARESQPVLLLQEADSTHEWTAGDLCSFLEWRPEPVFPSDGMTLKELSMTLKERAAQWPKQWFQEGREEGLAHGLAHERVLLRRMATSRFGAGTAERLWETLARVADPDRLADIGEWLVRCDTGEEFLARAGTPAAEARDRSDG